jgi:hypothetical protein
VWRRLAGCRAATAVMRPQQEEAAAAAAQALVPRDPSQGRERTRSESRSVRGREAVKPPTGGDSAPKRGRSRRSYGPAPEPAPEVLVVWSDGCAMSERLAHNAEASTSRAAPQASDTTPS